MTPEASAFAAITFAILTGGAGAPAGGVLATASGAALSSLESAVIIGTINNQGRVDKAFKGATRKDGIKNIAMSAVTAGATKGLTNTLEIPASTTSVAARVQNVAIQRGVNVAVGTTIGGEKLSDSVKSNAIGGIVDFGAGLAAQKIGEAYHASEAAEAFKAEHPDLAYMAEDVPYMSQAEHLAFHGFAGALSGVALGQNPLIQAAAQIAGEVTASAVKDAAGPDSKEQGIGFARLASSTLALVMGGNVNNINGAAEAGARAAENNTYGGQIKIEEWNEEQEKKKEKLARHLVEKGIVSEEAMDQAYSSLTLVDLEEIKADHGRAVSKDVKSSVEVSYDHYKIGKQAQLDVLRGDFQLEKLKEAASALVTDMSPQGILHRVFYGFELYSSYKPSSQVEEKLVIAPSPFKRVPAIDALDVAPSEPFQNKEYARNAVNMILPSVFGDDYMAAYTGKVKSSEDFRNLAPGAEYFKIAGDIKDRFSAKWGGKTRNYTQKIALNVTGNPHVAVTAGFGGAAALDFVADPLWVAGGAGKVVQTGKATIKGISGARAISRFTKSGAGFVEAVVAAKQGAGITERGVVAASEKAIAKDMSPRVKNGEGGSNRKLAQLPQKKVSDRSIKTIESRASLADELAQQPFDPFAARHDLEAVYGAKNVKTATLPAENAPGVKYRGGRNPESSVPYDMRGNPVFEFENNIKYQTILSVENFYQRNRAFHMRAATRQLRDDIKNGIISQSSFSETQMKAIMGGKAKIPDYTWHHDQQLGRMQLVKENVHEKTNHMGSIGQMKSTEK